MEKERDYEKKNSQHGTACRYVRGPAGGLRPEVRNLEGDLPLGSLWRGRYGEPAGGNQVHQLFRHHHPGGRSHQGRRRHREHLGSRHQGQRYRAGFRGRGPAVHHLHSGPGQDAVRL